jgi:long-chain acyl-CoA synthetase
MPLFDRDTPADVLDFYEQDVVAGRYAWSDLLTYVLERFGERVFATRRVGGRLQEWRYPDLAALALEVAEHLRAWGVSEGDRVAVLAESSPDFLAHVLGIGLAGACLVPVDPKLAPPEIARLLTHSEARRLLHSPACAEIARGLAAQGIVTEPLLTLPAESGPTPFLLAELRRSRVARPVATPLILLYTSGTSGDPKGVLLSVDNVLFGVQDALRAFPPRRAPAHYLSILPMNHVFELIGGALRPLVNGSRVTYVESAQSPELLQRLKSDGIDTMLVVPAFLGMLKKRLAREIDRDPRASRLWRLLGGLQRLRAPLRLRRWLARPLRRAFAPDLIRFAIGGAPTDLETHRFFARLGIHMLQGYGLSETTAATCLSHEGRYREGASGRAMPGVELRVDQPNAAGAGEILVRGRAVMLGYYRRDDLTREAMTADGWFRTGDLGRIDGDGFVWIQGRVRNLIVLPSGKKVVPEEVEAWLLRQPEVGEACVVAVEGRVWAVVTPAESWWKRSLGKSSVDDEVSRALVSALRSRDGRELSEHKVPAHYIVRAEPLPKTTTLKVKRSAVMEQLAGPA